MAKAKRNIGLEILEGIREIKRGEHGRVTRVPSTWRRVVSSSRYLMEQRVEVQRSSERVRPLI